MGDVFLGRVDGSDEATTAMLAALDTSVGGLLQQRTVDSLRTRAAEMGLTLITQTSSNGDVQLVFEQA
ncbi:hypothetical protein [Arthrobacter sp. CG_A4]|uniref:hypothetical protein n=1 Tax=Arthrobacter sp. CG_A4 TaxID=3071706 RepID=UPI002E0FB02A